MKDIFKKYKILSNFLKCHEICNYFFVFMEMLYFTLLCSFIDIDSDNHLTRAHENRLYNKTKYVNSPENSKERKALCKTSKLTLNSILESLPKLHMSSWYFKSLKLGL